MERRRYELFLNEYKKICIKYNITLSHEDGHGSFVFEDYDEFNIQWLKDSLDIHFQRLEGAHLEIMLWLTILLTIV